MRRRGLLAGIAGGALWPLLSNAQQRDPARRIGVVQDYEPADPEGRVQIGAFRDELHRLGWDIPIEQRSGAVDAEQVRGVAAEIMALRPDAVLGAGGTIVAALQRASRTIPIVFVNVTDPVGGGLVASLAKPGGNTTGFTQFEFGISAKWLELLKELAPSLTQVAVIRDPAARSGGGQLGAIQVAASALRVEVRPIDPRVSEEIERGLLELSRDARVGLIVTTSRLARLHRELIIGLAARYRMPAIYPFRVFADGGGLMCYGPNSIEPYRRAAGYVDQILKGKKPGELPVQAPTKYELVVNLKTAKALGLAVPPTLLARADDIIE